MAAKVGVIVGLICTKRVTGGDTQPLLVSMTCTVYVPGGVVPQLMKTWLLKPPGL